MQPCVRSLCLCQRAFCIGNPWYHNMANNERVDVLQEAVLAADVTCGLSLGEYTALTFAGAIRCACHSRRLFGIQLSQSFKALVRHAAVLAWLVDITKHAQSCMSAKPFSLW